MPLTFYCILFKAFQLKIDIPKFCLDTTLNCKQYIVKVLDVLLTWFSFSHHQPFSNQTIVENPQKPAVETT